MRGNPHVGFCSKGEAGDRLTYCTWAELAPPHADQALVDKRLMPKTPTTPMNHKPKPTSALPGESEWIIT